MPSTADAKIDEARFLDDQTKDKEVIFRLLSKFNLSVGDVAEIFAAYLLKHPANKKDLDRLRSALRLGATERQARMIAAVGELLTSEQVADLLGYSGRQTANNKKRTGELLAVSFPNRRGDFFPSFQFEGSRIRRWAPQLLKRIPNGWSALAFLTAKYDSLEGQSWLEVLGADSSRVDELLAAADAYVS
jgi:DNA-binding CsgD family transcriptional regulator